MPLLTTLPNGVRVLVEELPHTYSASIGLFVGIGSGQETGQIAGIGHFIEHMLFKGSQNYPTPKRISDAIEGVGGVLEAYTAFDSTVYYAKVADIHFERAVSVLADMLLRPRFDPADVEKERRVIIEELRETEDTPSDLVEVLLDRAMWGDQPVGRDIAGDPDSVGRISKAQIVEHWNQHYTANSLVVSIAGNVQAAHALEVVNAALGGLGSGTVADLLPTAPSLPGPSIIFHPDDSEQTNFCLAFPALSYADPDRRAMLVLDTILGGGSSSRLFQEIREERGLAYSIGSFVREYHDSGKWIVYGSIDPDSLEECVAAIMEQLRDLMTNGVTEEELQHVKEQVKGGMLLALEDTWSVASRNGAHQLRYGRVLPVEQVVAEVEAVTRADVQRVAGRVLHEDGLHLAIIGPYESVDGIEDLLYLHQP